jgi:hypothetical protein
MLIFLLLIHRTLPPDRLYQWHGLQAMSGCAPDHKNRTAPADCRGCCLRKQGTNWKKQADFIGYAS